MVVVPSLRSISKLASCHVLLDFVEETNLKLTQHLLTLLEADVYSAVTEELLECLLQFYSEKVTNELLKAVVPCHLRELKISKCLPHLTFFGLTEVMKKCPHLQRISLKECDQLMSPGQFVLWRRIGVSITALCLESCQNVTDQVVQSALRHIPTLQHLNVSSCESLTETVFLLSEDLQKEREFTPSHDRTHHYECSLVSVDVSGCPGITATAVRHLTSLTGPTLRNVNLSWTSINLIAILSLAGYSLPAMVELVISFYNKTKGKKDPKGDELYKCLLEFKNTLDQADKQQGNKEGTEEMEKNTCDHEEMEDKNTCNHEEMGDKITCDHEKIEDKNTCDHEEMEDKNTCDHEKMKDKNICEHEEVEDRNTCKVKTADTSQATSEKKTCPLENQGTVSGTSQTLDNNEEIIMQPCTTQNSVENSTILKPTQIKSIKLVCPDLENLDSNEDTPHQMSSFTDNGYSVQLDSVKIDLVDTGRKENESVLEFSQMYLSDLAQEKTLSNSGSLTCTDNSSSKELNNGAHYQIQNSFVNMPNSSMSSDNLDSSGKECGSSFQNSTCYCKYQTESSFDSSHNVCSGGLLEEKEGNSLCHKCQNIQVCKCGDDNLYNVTTVAHEVPAEHIHSIENDSSQIGRNSTDKLTNSSTFLDGQNIGHSACSTEIKSAENLSALVVNRERIIQTYKPQLVSVDITNKFTSVYETVGFDCLKEFLQCSPNLQKFGMSWAGLTDEMVKELTPYLTELREISLNDCESVTYGITHIGQTCKKLTKVDFNGIHFIKDMFLRPFLLNPELDCLYLAESDITDGTLFRLAARKMDKFQELDLSWCDDVTVQGLNALCRKPSSLTKLSFRHCPATTLTLALMAENFKQLQTLNICSVDSITDASVVYLVENLPLLQEIDISWNSGLSDVCVQALLKSCIFLKKAVLSGLKYLTSSPFLPIISDLEKFRRCQALLRFKLQERKILTDNNDEQYSSDEEYEELCVPHRSTSYAPCLQVLELEYCDCVDDNHLAEIVAVCRGSIYIVDYFREAIKPVMIHAQKGKLYLPPK